jgi:hypothetical protein
MLPPRGGGFRQETHQRPSLADWRGLVVVPTGSAMTPTASSGSRYAGRTTSSSTPTSGTSASSTNTAVATVDVAADVSAPLEHAKGVAADVSGPWNTP